MTSKGSQKKTKSSLSKVNLVKFGTPPPSGSQKFKRIDPLTAFKTPSSSWKSDGEPSSSQGSSKGKGKAPSKHSIKTVTALDDEQDDRMWVDIYEPTTEAELAVHKKKVEDVRRWLTEAFEGGPSGKLKKYRRLLALTGPAGTGKTTTVRVLAEEMGFEIMEWRNAVGESSARQFDDSFDSFSDNYDYLSSNYASQSEALFSKFEAFLNRASSCQNLFITSTSSFSPSSSQSKARSPPAGKPKRQIILLDDLPNILHSGTQTQFHAALQSLVTSPISTPPVPVIIVVSDAGMRGEASDERMAGGGGWGKSKDGVVDIRTVLSRELLGGPYVTQIGFNPIAPTLLTKALQALLNKHFSTSSHTPPSREVLDAVVESANGDIRSAIMALQFACVVELGTKSRKKKGTATAVLESVTRREQSLVLFHLMGKVLYNKRKGDPPSASASAKDIQREKLIDSQLKDPPNLPPGLQEHERRTSRIDVDVLYADSPIDSSLFSLYIHQNYPQFCDGVEQCEGVADWLSWVDASGGEAWYQANPHRFHLLTLGTLHSLPSPVARRSQKIYKPAFFDFLQKEKNAWDSVRDTRGWVIGEGTGREKSFGTWSQTRVAMELGGILKARDATGSSESLPPPTSHRLFSNLGFTFASLGVGEPLGENEMSAQVEEGENEYTVRQTGASHDSGGGWLESDDIEDF
ncbi:Cell cycle checkpoint protein RAD17 [Hypsizygus marmoreus]|uniref:Cell cycle checkpoint protein RAD17 n=1 Tax=Hypsizygus marmoreus TaxID=39966 RepID=A0A369K9Y4_HYPMA|nr:Cell cycle checkpoint protein RAD17 [Hypsizygus marmoreus]